MKTKFIWRVQNSEGNGPYNGHGNVGGIILRNPTHKRLTNLKKVPVPFKDEGLKQAFNFIDGNNVYNSTLIRDWRCGFQTIRKYHAWFSNDHLRELLDRAGFFLVKYEAPADAIRHGSKQSVFLPAKAKAVAVRDCDMSGITKLAKPKL
tara:strand:- start:346 stop:792 length:447 start_codon:yes stop_codon:yes gene_type:complete